MKFNLPGMDDVTDRKRPPSSFSLRLDPETPHTVCSWLLSLSFHKCTHTHTHTHTHTQEKRSYRGIQIIKINVYFIIHKLTGVHTTHTHTWNSTYMGIVVTIQKDPEFPPRLYTEVPHTVCPRMLSLIPQMHTHTYTHTHTRKKKIQVNTDHKNKCII